MPEQENIQAWLRLLRAPGLGARAIRALIENLGNAKAVIAASFAKAAPFGISEPAWRALATPDADLLAGDLRWLDQPGHHLLTWDSPDYPALLRRSPHVPAALFVTGNPELLWMPQIAIVGSRNPSAGGRANATDFAATLARSGLAVTSGLAEGIDAAAHTAALDAGQPTIAVIGTGPDRIYPARHRELAQRIAAHGAIVSEFPPGTPPRRDHFPRRNRIIAGLSLGTLVIEAGLTSGALITARLATEAGREVFALPGSIHNPLAKGCHRLIRDGAALIETALEAVDALRPVALELAGLVRGRLDASAAAFIPAHSIDSVGQEDADYHRLRQALGHDPAGIDDLAERTGLPVPVLSSMLLVLELEGKVAVTHGRYAWV